MLGGYQIIDLRGISVTMGNDVSITDLNVLGLDLCAHNNISRHEA